ncbi:MAG: pyrroline-5-carboxylate reductase [Candidatus Anaerobiospirillum pullicola]|uniref:Pyrroline-5-carboxylate reductase n=1 Tax=Candidatus Anaerobiospirillum pullicola TaxID=2838451 RepID=A0A948TG56_9GAMM|nr:pyrroline-5-carboxylate reductase [Candidatus Anaerobiospirillum pullicola]
MDIQKLKIAFIGGGNMSSCIFNGIVKTRPHQDEITVSGPHLEKLQHFKDDGATITTSNVTSLQNADVVFLGVKPQMMPEVLDEIKQSGVPYEDKLFISMAAGWRLVAFEHRLGPCRMIRIMPNTPAKLGLGVTAVCPGPHATAEDQAICQELLKGLGLTVMTDETGINSLGALAGSAPAFLYRFLEAMVAETEKYGFSPEMSRGIIEQMALGTVQMVRENHDTEISALREAVTSKGGTTFQGLKQMTDYKFEEMMTAAIDACMRRTHEFEEMFD